MVGEYGLGVFSERLTLSCRASSRLGRDSTNLNCLSSPLSIRSGQKGTSARRAQSVRY